MTPFGNLIRYFRQQSGVSQQQLAEAIGMEPTKLSAVERGQQRPLRGEELVAAGAYLGLGEDEIAALKEAADDSTTYLRIPSDASPRQYRLAHRLVRRLRHLSEQEINTIHRILDPTSAPALPRRE